jgi:hypothetical protein
MIISNVDYIARTGIACFLAYCLFLGCAFGQGQNPTGGGVYSSDRRLPPASGARVCHARQFAGSDVGARINACVSALGNSGGEIIHEGGGAWSTPAHLSERTSLHLQNGTYTLSTTKGAITFKGHSRITGSNATIVQNKNGVNELALYVILPYWIWATDDLARPNEKVRVSGLTIDGGNVAGVGSYGAAAAAILMGNAKDCYVTDNVLKNVAGIGINIGGFGTGGTDPLGLGKFADRCYVTGNTIIGARSQAISLINGKNVYIDENIITRPDSTFQSFTLLDVEPNTPSDIAEDVSVSRNIINVVTSNYAGGINAIGIQGVSGAVARRVRVEGNEIYGGIHAAATYLTIGIFASGTTDHVSVLNNRIISSNSSAIRFYVTGTHTNADISGNKIYNSGSGGAYAVELGTTAGTVEGNLISLTATNGNAQLLESGTSAITYNRNRFFNTTTAFQGIQKGASSAEMGTTFTNGDVVYPLLQATTIKLGTLTARGTCTATRRGEVYHQWGQAGVADATYICAKDDADTYDWRDLSYAPVP